VTTGVPPLRVRFVNENLGGHATVHLGIRSALAEHPEVAAEMIDVPAPGVLGRVLRRPIPGLGRRDLDLAPLRAQLVLSGWVRNELRRRRSTPADVLHVYTQHAALLCTAELRRIPSVVSTDASGAQVARLHPDRAPSRHTARRVALTSRLERRAFDAAMLVVAKSEWAARSLRGDYQVPDDRLRIVRFGITLPPEAVRRAPDGLPEVTFVANSMSRKGGWRLLDLYRAGLRGRCVLNLVTPEEVAPEPGVRVLRNIRPGDGQLDDVLARTRVLAFPSEMDTFGYAALEAMAAAVPVVGFAMHALPEIVVDGVTGFLVQQGDDAAFASALRRLLDDDSFARRMGAAGRDRISEHFDARKTTQQLLDVLIEARDRRREVP
jgi:glycosyltransferase involved in cell wall biosynthesis